MKEKMRKRWVIASVWIVLSFLLTSTGLAAHGEKAFWNDRP